MNVLIIGRYSGFVNSFIRKLSKEKHKIFVLCDPAARDKKLPEVFEQYFFEFTSDSIKEVFDSVSPDAVIYTGVYNTAYTFTRRTYKQDAIDYVSGLLSALIACTSVGIKNFFYLSSDCVFESDDPNYIVEESEQTTFSFKAMIYAQAESIVKSYRTVSQITPVIIRFANLYTFPFKRADCHDFCTSMCIDMLIYGKASYNERREFNGVFVNDAVEALYAIIRAENHRHNIYHIASRDIINEKQVYEIISDLYNKDDIVVTDKTIGERIRCTLDGTRAVEEFGISFVNSYERGIAAIYKYISANIKSFLTPEEIKKRSFFARLSSNAQKFLRITGGIIENIIGFVAVCFLERTTINSVYFAKLDFYLLYVLLFAIIYGRKHAIASAILSIIGYALVNISAKTSAFELLIDFNTYVWITQLFVVGLSVGHLKERIKLITDDKDEMINYLEVQLGEIEEIEESNRRIIHTLENRLINYSDSLGMLYDTVSAFDCLDDSEVLFQAAAAVSKMLGISDVSIYRIPSGNYARLFSATSDIAKSLGKSFDFTNCGDMTNSFNEKIVFVNRKFDTKYPSMAIALYNGDKIELIITVWNLKFEMLSLYTSNMLTIVGRIVSGSMRHANAYLDALSAERFIEGTVILCASAFDELLRVHSLAVERGVADGIVLHVTPFESNTYSYKDLSQIIKPCIRQTDFVGADTNGGLRFLLPNTSLKDSEKVTERLTALQMSVTSEELKAPS